MGYKTSHIWALWRVWRLFIMLLAKHTLLLHPVLAQVGIPSRFHTFLSIKTSSQQGTSPWELAQSHPGQFEYHNESTCLRPQDTLSSTLRRASSWSLSVPALPWPCQQRAQTTRWSMTCRDDWRERSSRLRGGQRSPLSSSCSCDHIGWLLGLSLAEMMCCRRSVMGHWPILWLLHLQQSNINEKCNYYFVKGRMVLYGARVNCIV